MPTKLRFEVQGKSPLVYLTFYNDDFEKNLAKENADDFAPSIKIRSIFFSNRFSSNSKEF